MACGGADPDKPCPVYGCASPAPDAQGASLNALDSELSLSDLLSSAASESREDSESGSGLFLGCSGGSSPAKRHRRTAADSTSDGGSPGAAAALPFMDPNINTDSNISYVGRDPATPARPVETGFVTGSNRRVLVEEDRLDAVAGLLDPGSEGGAAVSTGFVTGTRKRISVDAARLVQGEGLLGLRGAPFCRPPAAPSCRPPAAPSCRPPAAPSRMEGVFMRVCARFRRHEAGWVFAQFRWAWLHLCLNPPEEGCALEDAVVEAMQARLRSERSVLRRIVEHDDVACRYMVLGVVRLAEERVELYDGFYSLWARTDGATHAMLRRRGCDTGARLHVFGAELLLAAATSIFEVSGDALRLHYNGVRVASCADALGYSRSIAFLDRLAWIRADGGTVSAVVVTVRRVVETRYMVRAAGYRSVVDDPEAELEKVHRMAVRAGRALEEIAPRVCRFTRMVVTDGSAECLLTWWGAPEAVVAGARYKFVYLRAAASDAGLHLSTSNKSYVERVYGE